MLKTISCLVVWGRDGTEMLEAVEHACVEPNCTNAGPLDYSRGRSPMRGGRRRRCWDFDLSGDDDASKQFAAARGKTQGYRPSKAYSYRGPLVERASTRGQNGGLSSPGWKLAPITIQHHNAPSSVPMRASPAFMIVITSWPARR